MGTDRRILHHGISQVAIDPYGRDDANVKADTAQFKRTQSSLQSSLRWLQLICMINLVRFIFIISHFVFFFLTFLIPKSWITLGLTNKYLFLYYQYVVSYKLCLFFVLFFFSQATVKFFQVLNRWIFLVVVYLLVLPLNRVGESLSIKPRVIQFKQTSCGLSCDHKWQFHCVR